MKKATIITMGLIVILLLNACSFSVSSANFNDLQMASEVDGSNKPVTATSTFFTDSPIIYVTGTVKNAPEGTVIEAMWIYVESDPDIDIDSATLQLVDINTDFVFSLSIPNNGWPTGKYEVKLSIDGNYKESLYFTVE